MCRSVTFHPCNRDIGTIGPERRQVTLPPAVDTDCRRNVGSPLARSFHPSFIPRPIPFHAVPAGSSNRLTRHSRSIQFQIVKRGRTDNAEVASSILASPTHPTPVAPATSCPPGAIGGASLCRTVLRGA